jgi:hypothetical protein
MHRRDSVYTEELAAYNTCTFHTLIWIFFGRHPLVERAKRVEYSDNRQVPREQEE